MDLPPLQPLRIPAGWVVQYHNLREADASPHAIDADWLREDLLQIEHPASNVLVDVGWYGDAESGEFVIYVQDGDFQGRSLHEFRSRDRLSIVTELERLLSSPGQID